MERHSIRLLNDLNNIIFSLLLVEKESLIFTLKILWEIDKYLYTFAILHGSLALVFVVNIIMTF